MAQEIPSRAGVTISSGSVSRYRILAMTFAEDSFILIFPMIVEDVPLAIGSASDAKWRPRGRYDLSEGPTCGRCV